MPAQPDTMPLQEMPRADAERVARIIGPQSAAAQALRCVDDQYGGDAVIARPAGGSSLVVVPSADWERMSSC